MSVLLTVALAVVIGVSLGLLGGLPMPVAVGTSLVVIAMKSFAGLAGYLSSVDIHWGLAAADDIDTPRPGFPHAG